jgi:hypothetical protein
MNAPCKRCNGLGYISVRGEAMAAAPCGCADWQDDDDTEDEPTEWQEWRDYDPEC